MSCRRFVHFEPTVLHDYYCPASDRYDQGEIVVHGPNPAKAGRAIASGLSILRVICTLMQADERLDPCKDFWAGPQRAISYRAWYRACHTIETDE